MRVLALDHINIAGSAELIGRCRAFYVDVLGLSDGHRPAFRSRGFWLYAGDAAIVHLTVNGGETDGGTHGAFNHFAMACDGLEDAIARLKAHGIGSTSAKFRRRIRRSSSCRIRQGSPWS